MYHLHFQSLAASIGNVYLEINFVQERTGEQLRSAQTQLSLERPHCQ